MPSHSLTSINFLYEIIPKAPRDNSMVFLLVSLSAAPISSAYFFNYLLHLFLSLLYGLSPVLPTVILLFITSTMLVHNEIVPALCCFVLESSVGITIFHSPSNQKSKIYSSFVPSAPAWRPNKSTVIVISGSCFTLSNYERLLDFNRWLRT